MRKSRDKIPIGKVERGASRDGTSRMNREVQVRIREGLGVKFPGLLGIFDQDSRAARATNVRTYFKSRLGGT